MALTTKALGLLLAYPSPEICEVTEEIEAALRGEERLSVEGFVELGPLLTKLRYLPKLDLEENYVSLFDSTKGLSLYLYEHVHGDGRERGQAMADLAALYAKHGFAVEPGQLPDYIPAFCEFLSFVPEALEHKLLAEVAPLFAVLEARLRNRGSDYAAVFGVLVELSGVELDRADIESAGLEALRSDARFEDVDSEWEEEEVTFCGAELEKSFVPVAPANELVHIESRESLR